MVVTMSIQEQNKPENARDVPRCPKHQKEGNQICWQIWDMEKLETNTRGSAGR